MLSSVHAKRSQVLVPATTVADRRPELRFEQTVRRHLVHRACVNEVFITDGRPLTFPRYLVAAQWPRDHALFEPDLTRHSDPMLAIETIRQAGIYLAQRFYSVPETHRFIFRALTFEVLDVASLRIGQAPTRMIIDVGFNADTGWSRTGFGGSFDAMFTIGDSRCLRATASLLAVDGEKYARLRYRDVPRVRAGAKALGALLPPERVGRRRVDNVVLREGPGGWWMNADTEHPGYFEHPSDHVPGMLLLEAFRQAGHASAPMPLARMVGLDTVFERFGELHRPVRIAAEKLGEADLGFTATQDGAELARARVRMAG